MRITAGCTWEQGYNGANCEGELDGLAKYSKGIHNEMCFPEEVSLDFAIDETIELMNGYRVNTTYSSIGKLFQSYGSFCSTGPSSPSKCFSNSGLSCPFYTKDRYTVLQDETKHCKPNDVNADTP